MNWYLDNWGLLSTLCTHKIVYVHCTCRLIWIQIESITNLIRWKSTNIWIKRLFERQPPRPPPTPNHIKVSRKLIFLFLKIHFHLIFIVHRKMGDVFQSNAWNSIRRLMEPFWDSYVMTVHNVCLRWKIRFCNIDFVLLWMREKEKLEKQNYMKYFT